MSSAGQYGIMIPGETCFKFTNDRPKNNNRRKSSHYFTDRKPNDEIMSDENEDNEEYEEHIEEEKDERHRQNEQEINIIEQDEQQQQEILCPASSSLAAKKTKGRVKIKMEFIDNKLRRYTTFSKRKTGIMKKAFELSTLTGTQVMLLVASETGHVYTFATKKLQPMITSDTGKALIQGCLNTPDADSILASTSNNQQEIDDPLSTTAANQNESSPINLTNQKRKDQVIKNFGTNCRKRFKSYHNNNNNSEDQLHKVDKQQQREQQPSTFIFPSKLGDLPTMVTSNASMLFSVTDSLINYNNGDSGEKTIGGAGDRPSSSSSSTPESSSSSLSTNNDRFSKSENIPKSDLAEVNPCNGNLPKRRSTTKNRNLDSATNASTTENNQNTLLSTFLQSMIMNSAAMAATMKNEQNDKNLNNEEIDNNKNQNVSVSSPIFPFTNFFPSTLTASGQGQAQGFGFLPAGLAANGSLMYQMSQNLLYPPAGTENGTGEAPTPQQQYITIPFPVPFNQTMLASQILNNLVNNSVDNQSQLKKSRMTLEHE